MAALELEETEEPASAQVIDPFAEGSEEETKPKKKTTKTLNTKKKKQKKNMKKGNNKNKTGRTITAGSCGYCCQ